MLGAFNKHIKYRYRRCSESRANSPVPECADLVINIFSKATKIIFRSSFKDDCIAPNRFNVITIIKVCCSDRRNFLIGVI